MIRLTKTLLAAAVPLTLLVGEANASIASGLSASSYTQSQSYAGHNAEAAFNGSTWIAPSFDTQWVQVDLGASTLISQISFMTGQSPSGVTWQNLYISDSAIQGSWSSLTAVASRSGYSTDSMPLSFSFAPVSGRYIEIVSHGGTSWTSLAAINVTAVPEPEGFALGVTALAVMALAFARRKAR